MIGETISHYKIIEKIGEGGMGIIYKAEDLKLGRKVVLKAMVKDLSFDERAKERFRREARICSALQHPNITVIYDMIEEDNQEFICMEYIEGKTLEEIVNSETLDIDKILVATIFRDLFHL